MMEEIIRDHSNANSDFHAAILRYFNPVGAHPSGKIGEDPKEYLITWFHSLAKWLPENVASFR